MEWFKSLVLAFLVLNAILWGLYPHSVHCNIASAFGVTNCPSHWVHISTGVVFFLLAVVVAQWPMFKNLNVKVM